MPRGLLVRRNEKSARHFAYGDTVYLSVPKSSSSASDSSCSPSYYQPSPLSDDRSDSPSDEPQVLDLRICTINAAIAAAAAAAAASTQRKSLTPTHHNNLVSRMSVKKVTPFSSNRSNNTVQSKKIIHNNSNNNDHDNSLTYKCINNNNNNNNNNNSITPISLSNEGKRKKSKTPVRSTEHKRIRSLVRKSDATKNSPVSGTVILDSDDEDEQVRCGNAIRRNGDIDPSLNLVVVSEEAKAELAKIKNTIGDYNCCLCHQKFDDAFALAQHSCPRIVHLEYRCPDCEKVFNCPANLASHRRWHKPRST